MITWINTAAASWWDYMAASSVQSGLFFLGILCLSILFRTRSATFLHLLWFTVIVKALLPPALRVVPVDFPLAVPRSILEFTVSNPHTGAGAPPGFTLPGLLFLTWCVVIVGAFGVFLWKNYALSGYLRQHRAEPPFLKEMSQDFSSIPIFIVPEIRTPLTYGMLRPAVYLPEAAVTWDETKLILVLRHEMAHIARRDAFWGLLQMVTQMLFFFHPGIWIANRQINLYRELACDDRALIPSEHAWRDYGEILLSFLTPARERMPWSITSQLTILDKRGIRQRFHYLTEYKEEHMLSLQTFEKLALIGIMAGALFLSCQQDQPVNPAASIQSTETISDGTLENQGIIYGTIVDKDRNEPLPGANIFALGTKLGAASNHRGEFQFTVPPGKYTIIGQFLGFGVQSLEGVQIPPNTQTRIQFQMTVDKRPFEEQVKERDRLLGMTE